MPIKTKAEIERELADCVQRCKCVQDASKAAKMAAQQPEPDVTPRNVTVLPTRVTGTGTSR